MSDNILNNLLKEYEQKKYLAELNFQRDKTAFYNSNPKLLTLNEKLGKIALNISKAILNNDMKLEEDLHADFEALKRQKDEFLKSLEIPKGAMEPLYECQLCKDTGFVETSNGRSVLCNCIQQKMYDMSFNKSHIGNIQKENFDTFDETLYSDEADALKYNSKFSPRENILIIKNIAQKFIDNFDDPEAKNLLFTGNTGLGKTFLSNCIAKQAMDLGKTVLYQTAPIMVDTIIDFRFGKSELRDFYNDLMNVDLLIIDDLGVEALNQIKISEWFNIINTRLLCQNNHTTKTIISTNLSMTHILDAYGERIFSRLACYYSACRFYGDDIRLRTFMNN